MLVFIQQKGPDGTYITRLLAESGPMRGKMFRIKASRVAIGSGDNNQIILPLPEIDTLHAEIDLRGATPMLRNRSQRGGVLVNDKAVKESPLKHGDRIAFQGETAPQAAKNNPAKKDILITQRAVVPVSDDVRTMLGSPMARWGAGAVRAGSGQPKVRPAARPNMPARPVANYTPQQRDEALGTEVMTGFTMAQWGGAAGTPRAQPAPAPQPPPQAQPAPEDAFKQKKFEIMLAIGKALSRPEDISKKVERVLELLFDTMDIDRAAILVLEDDSGKENLEFTWTSYRDKHGPTDTLDLSSTIIKKVLEEEVAVLTQDAQSEDWLDGARSVFGQAIRTCICTPLKTSSGVLGVLYADSARTSHPFSGDDMEFFTAFSNQGAIAIENARLLRVALEKERLEQDMRLARRIQRTLFPRKLPPLSGYQLAGDSNAMDQVGGDYFDYLLLERNLLALVVGDVSGHGISSALVMTMTRSILRGSLLPEHTPAQILQRVNHLVSEDMVTRMFVTMVLVMVDLDTGRFVYSSAGHNPLLKYSAHEQKTGPLLKPRGGPLGMSRWARLKPKYKDIEGQLLPGDVLFLYTDGLEEAANPTGEQFEEERLRLALHKYALYPPEDQLKGIFKEVDDFCQGVPIGDDTTGIILKRNPM